MLNKDLLKHLKKGNLKLPRTTLIFNMSSAHACVSRSLGLCQLEDPSRCYALRAEKQYSKTVLPYRNRQAAFWRNELPATWVDTLRHAATHGIRCNAVRFNESGDFISQTCLNKLKHIARDLPELTFYGFTSRNDLTYNDLPANLTINTSG